MACPGHWEGDLICGAGNRSAIGTLVERSSRYTMLLHLPGRHTAQAVRDAVIAALGDLPEHLRRSLTWDQGSEMALHADIAAGLGMPVFFCQKASPWQRPSNEHTNGLVRQYFPKGTDLRRHSPDQLAAVAAVAADSTPGHARPSTGTPPPSGWPASAWPSDPHSIPCRPRRKTPAYLQLITTARREQDLFR